MKTILLQAATLVYPGHAFDGQRVDMLLEDGIIAKFEKGNSITHKTAEVIDAKDAFLAPGFFDLNTNFGEPGFETKETITSGCSAAAAGGFTGLALQPNTNPPISSQAEVKFLLSNANDQLVSIYPIGCISKCREGKELAELYDMKTAGAVAFSDGDRSIEQAGLMSRALLYAKGFNALVFSFAEDVTIAGTAKMNEGEMSTYLGMKGNPNLAEELTISRDLHLADYHQARIHFSTISTEGGVNLIRRAKKAGLPVTCDVAVHHLVFTDESIAEFDSNYKVKPPLRTVQDLLALKKAVLDGTIDAIVSQHTPHEIEFKQVEFEIAAYGMIGLQTVLPLLLQARFTPDLIVEKLAINPRKLLGLPLPLFNNGMKADLVLFNPEKTWKFDKQSNKSRSANSPYFNRELTGKVMLVVNNGQIYMNS